MVGISPADDSAVWRLDDHTAVVLTTDFFTPVVDDPYDYGAIAAANSISDIYAMGGKPILALNIAAFPPNLPVEVSREIIRGGAEKAKEAGVVIAGGHTIQDKEPKYGLVVLGLIKPEKILTKNGANPGDKLFLSKPLGFGVTTTALKRGLTSPEELQEVTNWMKRLNHPAAEIATKLGFRGATDVTGYSLLGHAWEMAEASGVGLEISIKSIPFISCAKKFAEAYAFPGGAFDNKLFFESHIEFDASIPDHERMLLFDSQTSGGLLVCVPPGKINSFQQELINNDVMMWEIGKVTAGSSIRVKA